MAPEASSSARARVALVTGGGSGIGRATALRLARDGFAVAVSGRDRERLDATVAQIVGAGGAAAPVEMDVTSEDAVRSGVASVRAALGAPVVVVNNAGIAESRKFTDLTLDAWQRTFAVNVAGAFLVTRECVADMTRAGWGRVVTIGSTASVQGFPYVAHYVASKHALLGMTRSLALELASKGVTANCVCPGYVDTEMTGRTLANIAQKTGRSVDDARRALERQSPQNRLIAPAEVADAVSWLCSDGAAGVNGQAVVLNGG